MSPVRPPLPTAHVMLASLAASVFLAWSGASSAQSTPAAEQAPSRAGIGIGLGLGLQSRPYKGIDNDTRLLPILSYENSWLRVAGLGVDLKLGSAGPVDFALGARYALSAGYEAEDAAILAGMAEREGGLWLGPSLTWRSGIVDVSAEALFDASRHSEGQQFRLSLDRSFDNGPFRFTPRIVGIWRDRKYNDYYFGVRAAEVRADRPLYEGQAGTDVEFGLRVNYLVSRQHALFLDLSQTVHGQGVKDSPLVDESSSVGARFGYVYRF